jgi:alpha-tubulin suppressor-like RCC1 family protein
VLRRDYCFPNIQNINVPQEVAHSMKLPPIPNVVLAFFRFVPLWIIFWLFAVGFVSAQTVGTPEFAPDAADGKTPFSVTITCATPAATIRYTTNGADPDVNSVPVPFDGKVLIASNLTLKARGFHAGMTGSAVKTATYRVTGAITGGGFHVLALLPDGALFSWGPQGSGRLGNGLSTPSNVLSPTTVLKTGGTPLTNVVDVAGGYLSSIALDKDGKVWVCGSNSNGQLGSNSNADTNHMQRVLKDVVAYGVAGEVNFLSDIVSVAMGHDFAAAVDGPNGKVWTWGQRASGRLGDGYVSTSAAQRLYAQPVTTGEAGNPDLTGAVLVRCGPTFALALTSVDSRGRGLLWAWGQNAAGQLGQGDLPDSARAVPVKRDATATTYPAGNWMDDVVDFAAGDDHVVVICMDGSGNRTVWCWGQQLHGRLGNGTTTSDEIVYPVQVLKSAGVPLTDIIQVAAAGRFSLALDRAGKVWAWGENADGQLGDGSLTESAYAQPVKTLNGVDLSEVVYIGAGGTGQASPPLSFALAITSNRSVFTWGQNTHGQSGSGSTGPSDPVWATASSIPQRFGNQPPSISLAFVASSVIAPADYDLTVTSSDPDGTIASVEFFENGTSIGTDLDGAPWTLTVSDRVAGEYVFMALATDNLGAFAMDSRVVSLPESSPPVDTPVPYPPAGGQVEVDQILISSTAGADIHFTISTDGAEPPDPTAASASIPANTLMRIPRNAKLRFFAAKAGMSPSSVQTAYYSGTRQIAAGSSHSLLVNEGKVWAWGANENGQLGLGHHQARFKPTLVPGLSDVRAVSANLGHSLALIADGTVLAWGDNDSGQLGDDTTIDRPLPGVVASLTDVVAVGTGTGSSVALKADGTVWTWGSNFDGTLGTGVPLGETQLTPAPTSLTGIVAISGGGIRTLALKNDGTVWSWGNGLWGAIGDGFQDTRTTPVQVAGLTDVVAISTGGIFSMALTKSGTIYGWGSNSYGSVPAVAPNFTILPVPIDSPNQYVAIAAGAGHAVAIRKDGRVQCWGLNPDGQCAAPWAVIVSINEVESVTNACMVAASTHTLALTASDIWAWGNNASGQIGDGIPPADRFVPYAVALESANSDNDQLPDGWEYANFGNLEGDGSGDADADGLPDEQEYQLGTNPNRKDTDGDGSPDQTEVLTGTEPNDTIPTTWLLSHGKNPVGLDPDADEDQDGLGLREEWLSGGDPNFPDTDADGVLDGADAVVNDADLKFARTPLPAYTILDLGPAYQVIAVNDAMQVVYWDENGHSMLWDNGIVSQIVDSSEGYATGISNTGLVIGTLHDGHAFRWTATQSLESIPFVFPDAESATPRFVGDNGSFVISEDWQTLTTDYERFLHYDPVNATVIASFDEPVNPTGPLTQSWYFPMQENIRGERLSWYTSRHTEHFSGELEGIPVEGWRWVDDVTEVRVGTVAISTYFFSPLLNGMDPPLVTGSGGFGGLQDTSIWVNTGTWTKKLLLASQTSMETLGGEAIGLNDHGQIILRDGRLWQNGRALPLHDLIVTKGWQDIQLPSSSGQTFNNQGVILASALQAGVRRAVLLFPVESRLVVDANRDGRLLAQNAAGAEPDRTSASKPYRFWINNDHDVFHVVDGTDTEYDDLSDGVMDASYTSIKSERDLEDFSRLRINLQGLTRYAKDPNCLVQLRFRSIDGAEQVPASDGQIEINVYEERNPAERALYLEDQATATSQRETPYDTWIGGVSAGLPMNLFNLRPQLRENLSEENPILNLLFCGRVKGRGQLVLTIRKGNETVAELAPLHLELLDIKDMYERWTVGDGSGGDPGVLPIRTTRALATGYVPPGNLRPFEYLATHTEEKRYILYVHGWNMKPEEKDVFAETAFKRLFWQGYRGRFGAFQWPTTHSFGSFFVDNTKLKTKVSTGYSALTDYTNYDRGEWSAWRSAVGLKRLLIRLQASCPGEVYMVAHSMGNVVAGEALRLAAEEGLGELVNTYVASQAAIPVHVYAGSQVGVLLEADVPVSVLTSMLDGGFPETANIYKNWLAANSGAVGRRVNFYNGNDYALWHDCWEANQYLKPDHSDAPDQRFNYDYTEDPLALPVVNGFRKFNPAELIPVPIVLQLGSTHAVADRYEIMAFAAEAWSRALGAVPVSNGAFDANVDLSGFGHAGGRIWPLDPVARPYAAHKWHSAQFRSTNMLQRGYWNELLGPNGFDIAPQNP